MKLQTTESLLSHKARRALPQHFKAATLHEPGVHSIPWKEQLDGKTNFEMLWVIRGDGEIRLEGNIFSIGQESVYLISPGRERSYRFSDDIEGYYISFSPLFIRMAETGDTKTLLPKQFESGIHCPVTCINIGSHNEMTEIVERIYREYSNYFTLRLEILQGLMNLCMIYFTRQRGEPLHTALNRDHLTVSVFLRMVSSHFRTKKMVADYAAELNLTPNYLNRLVKKHTGFPASYHIQQQILAEAKKQAIYADTTMKQVAYLLGFENVFHFSRFFKANSGVNFTQFKKEHLLMP